MISSKSLSTFIVVALATGFGKSLAVTTTSSPSVRLDSALFRGATHLNETLTRFLGIPYGESTAFGNRFRPPIPIAHYKGVYNATEYGPACPQQALSPLPGLTISIPTPANISEDCLTVNVIVPTGTKPGDKMPVAFYIYGGGFEIGSADQFDGSLIVSQSVLMRQPVIFVSVNYRNSAWGFMASREIQESGYGNFGLLDQRLGLKWVQKYITQFGGDPSNVVLWGESSGAISIGMQLVAENGNNGHLFQGAIMQAGSPFPLGDMSSGQRSYDLIVQNTGCLGNKSTLDCLRSIPYDTLQKAVDSTPNIFDYTTVNLTFRPVVDGKFITKSPQILVREKKVAGIPFITGDCDDEGTDFALPLLNITTDSETRNYWQTNYFPTANSSVIDSLAQLYPNNIVDGSPYDTGTANNLTSQYKRLASFQGDLVFQAPRRSFLSERADKVKTWSFLSKRFKDTPALGAFHGSDLNLTVTGTSDLQEYFINFVNNLDPNKSKAGSKRTFDLIDWPTYSTKSRLVLTALDANKTTGVAPLVLSKDDYRVDAIAYLNELVEQFPL